MPYNEETGWVVATKQEIVEKYVKVVNSVLNTAYTSETLIGTQLWVLLQVVIFINLQIEQESALLMSFLEKSIKAMDSEISLNSAGLYEGIKEGLLTIEGVVDVGTLPPQSEVDRGILGVSILFSPPFTSNPPLPENPNFEEITNKNKEIANMLAIRLGAGILTKEGNIWEGILANGQLFPFKFSDVVEKSVWLRFSYKLSEGSLKPSDTDLKQKLRNTIDFYLEIGGRFIPSEIATSCNFSFFRYSLLEYSFDGLAYSNLEILTSYKEKWVFLDDNINFQNVG